MERLEVQDYAGERLGTAREFVKSRLTWAPTSLIPAMLQNETILL